MALTGAIEEQRHLRAYARLCSRAFKRSSIGELKRSWRPRMLGRESWTLSMDTSSENCQAPSQNTNPQPSQTQSKSVQRGLGLTLKSYGPPPPHHPITFRSPVRYYMVQVEASSTPECQEGVPSQGGHQREEHRVVHCVQEVHNEGHIQ